jgi:hypothetical protein
MTQKMMEIRQTTPRVIRDAGAVSTLYAINTVLIYGTCWLVAFLKNSRSISQDWVAQNPSVCSPVSVLAERMLQSIHEAVHQTLAQRNKLESIGYMDSPETALVFFAFQIRNCPSLAPNSPDHLQTQKFNSDLRAIYKIQKYLPKSLQDFKIQTFRRDGPSVECIFVWCVAVDVGEQNTLVNLSVTRDGLWNRLGLEPLWGTDKTCKSLDDTDDSEDGDEVEN